jgi:hypothetical protein
MSRIIQSTVAGIALTLTLGATAAHARPQSRADTRPATTATPAGIAEIAWSWWNALLEKAVPSGRGGFSAIRGKAGSQMDPDGLVVVKVPPQLYAPSPHP